MINRPVMGSDQPTELAQHHPADGAELPLPLEHAGESGEVRLDPILLAIALDRIAQIGNHRIDVVFELGHFAARLDLDGTREVTLSHLRGDLRDGPNLGGEVRSETVDVAGEVLPCPGRARNDCLHAEPAVSADLAGNTRDLRREAVELIDHAIDGVLQLQDLTAYVRGDLFGQVAIGHCLCYIDDVADLTGQVRRHQVHAVCEVLPGSRDAGHRRLAAQLAIGANLPRHAGHLGGETVELIDHRIHDVLQRENLAPYINGDFARKISSRNGRCDQGDVADLCGEVSRHGVHGVGETLPGTRRARHDGLAAEAAFGADLAGHSGNLRSKRPKLVDHRVDG